MSRFVLLLLLPILAGFVGCAEQTGMDPGVRAYVEKYGRRKHPLPKTSGKRMEPGTPPTATDSSLGEVRESEEAGDPKESSGPTDQDAAAGSPRITILDPIYDFGSMEPFQKRQHTFVIRNGGDAPLKVEAGQTSCKCTFGTLADGSIAPGEETTVTLTWRSASGGKYFSHEAEILTNDPETPVAVVAIRGDVLSTLLADPESFSMPGIYPGKATSSTVTVTSQLWEAFEIEDLRTSFEGLQWDVTPLDLADLERIRAKSGYRITVHIPDNLKRGFFKHWLRLNVIPEGESSRVCEIPINGNVLRRVSIYGEGIDSTGLIKLGKIRRGEGLKRYFAVKVRGKDPTLEVESMEVDPSFVKVSIEENERVGKPGLYRLLLEIPKSAPPSVYMGEPGSLRVAFKNPLFEDLDLKLEFAVMGELDF